MMLLNSVLLEGKAKSYDGNGSYEVEYKYRGSAGRPIKSMVTVLVAGKLKECLESFIGHDTMIRVVGVIVPGKNGGIAINAEHVEKSCADKYID